MGDFDTERAKRIKLGEAYKRLVHTLDDLESQNKSLSAEDSRKETTLEYIKMQCEQELETPCEGNPHLFVQHILDQVTASTRQCEHGEEMTDYCLPCGRIHSA